jgi:phosphate uptake regulator
MPEKVLRRIQLISLEMEKDAVQSLVTGNKELAKTMIERDEEVDRLYFLIVRLVRAALTQPNLGEKYSITPIECLDYRLLASLIEHFADYAASIGNVTISTTINEYDDLKEKIKVIGDLIYQLYQDSFTAFIKKDIMLAESLLGKFQKVKEQLANIDEFILKLGKKERERLTLVVIALTSMCEVCIDVSDLARAR